MKKLIILITMLVMLTVSVQASTYVDDFFGIDYDYAEESTTNGIDSNQDPISSCGSYVYMDEVREIQSDEIASDFATIFGEGYHVVYFSQGGYEGNEYFTAYFEDDKLKWVKNGKCGDDYKLYTVDYDFNNLRQDYEEYEYDEVKLGKHIYSKIKGVSLIQKFKIFQKLVKHGIM